MRYEIIYDADGQPLEVRVELEGGAVAISGIVGGDVREHPEIPAEIVAAVKTELRQRGH